MKRFNLTKFLLAIAIMVFVLPSCTLSEPPIDEYQPNTGNNILLTDLSFMGFVLTKIEYDELNRPTALIIPEEMEIRISYSPLTLKITEWDEDYDEYGQESRYQYISDWTNIETNSHGYITKATINERYFSGPDQSNPETDQWTETMTYDSNGHLLSVFDGEDIINFNWDNKGRLLSCVGDGETSYIEYYDTKNPHFQWGLDWDDLSYFHLTGLFGTAPSYLPSKVVNRHSSTLDFSYQLQPNGLIAQQEYIDEYGEKITINFNYGSTRSDSSSILPSKKTKRNSRINIFSHKK